MASYKVGLPAGSPPPVRAATSMFLINLANILPRLASMTAFLCLVVAHFECPLMQSSPCSQRTRAPAYHRSVPGETRWPADAAGESPRFYPWPARPPRVPTPRRRVRLLRPTERG